MNQYTVAIVEDDYHLQQLLKLYFEQAGLRVQCFGDYPQAFAAITDAEIDAWVLDIMLPNGDGRELLAHLRNQHSQIPIMCLSARDSEYDRIQGLELGCDDYIVKPFSAKEVVLRLQRLLQRVYGQKEPYIVIGDYRLDCEREQLITPTQTIIPLTYREFQCLAYLAAQHQRPVTRQQVLDHVWGVTYFGSDRVVDDLVRRLRKKVPDLPLQTIYGQGYRLG